MFPGGHYYESEFTEIYFHVWVEITQSAQRLSTGWRVRESNTGGGRDIPHPSRPALGFIQLLVQWIQGFFPEGKADEGWNCTTLLHIAFRLKQGTCSRSLAHGRPICYIEGIHDNHHKTTIYIKASSPRQFLRDRSSSYITTTPSTRLKSKDFL